MPCILCGGGLSTRPPCLLPIHPLTPVHLAPPRTQIAEGCVKVFLKQTDALTTLCLQASAVSRCALCFCPRASVLVIADAQYYALLSCAAAALTKLCLQASAARIAEACWDRLPRRTSNSGWLGHWPVWSHHRWYASLPHLADQLIG